ncbi:MAG: hypothetical protein R3E85_08600 [Planctomycetota bacterium]
MHEPRTYGDLTIRVADVPPVYDPGGPTWVASGEGADADYRAMEADAVREAVVQLVVPEGDPIQLEPLGYRAMSTFWRGNATGEGTSRPAAESDLAFMLRLAAARRAAYAAVEPVFWREAKDATALQEPWFRHLIAEDDTRVLCEPEGFLIAAPRRGEWLVDDFVVTQPELWPTAGRRLLMSLDGPVLVVVATHDVPKQALVRALEFEPAFQWFQKTLR